MLPIFKMNLLRNNQFTTRAHNNLCGTHLYFMFILQYGYKRKLIFPLGSDQNPSVEHAEAAIRDFQWPSADALVP
jgi:hypothetical protein